MPRDPIPAPILKLLHDDMVPRGESPGQHIRNAIQALILADERLAQLPAPDHGLVTLIRSAEARCFRALFELAQEEL